VIAVDGGQHLAWRMGRHRGRGVKRLAPVLRTACNKADDAGGC
jgi:hypothetical protein